MGACLLDELAELAIQPLQLRSDDGDPREHRYEDDEVGRRHVLPFRWDAVHVSSSRSSRMRMSMRLPASSTAYNVANSASIAARHTQKVKNCEPVICGPRALNTVGWTRLCESRIARNDTGTSTTPNSA